MRCLHGQVLMGPRKIIDHLFESSKVGSMICSRSLCQRIQFTKTLTRWKSRNDKQLTGILQNCGKFDKQSLASEKRFIGLGAFVRHNGATSHDVTPNSFTPNYDIS